MNQSYVLYNPKEKGYLTTGALYGSTMVTPNPLFAHHYTSETIAGNRAKQIADGKEVLTVCLVSNPTVEQLSDIKAPPPKTGFIIEIVYDSGGEGYRQNPSTVWFRQFPYGWDDPSYDRKVYDTFNRGALPKIWKTAEGAKPALAKLEARAKKHSRQAQEYKFKIIPYVDVK